MLRKIRFLMAFLCAPWLPALGAAGNLETAAARAWSGLSLPVYRVYVHAH